MSVRRYIKEGEADEQEVIEHEETETIRGRHGPQTGGRTLGGPHRGRP